MGYMQQHSIMVVSDEGHIEEIRSKAVELFGPLVSNTIPTIVNSNRSFGIFVGPDGSKEGWETSDEHDVLRDQFKIWIREHDYLIDWVEVTFGGDDSIAFVVDHDGDDAE